MKNSNLSFLLKTVFITVFTLIGFSAYAQNSFNVKVKFVDTNTNEDHRKLYIHHRQIFLRHEEL